MRVRVSAWAIRNPIPVAIVFAALTIMGLLAYSRLPIKQYPNVNFPVVSVSVTQAGAAPEEMENQVTRPVENAIAGVVGVKHIASTVTLGASSTGIEFELGSDMQKATDDVRTAIDRIRANLPSTIDAPRVQRIDVDSAPILTYAVHSDSLSPSELAWFVDDTVSRRLQAQKGVAQVARVGGDDREINVILNPDRMRAFGVTAPQVSQAVSLFSADDTGGRANVGGQEQTLRVLGAALTADQLREMTIPVNGRFVRLGDVAEVGDGVSEERGFARLDGRPAVAFQVNKTRDASDVTTEEGVTKAIDQLARENPKVQFLKVVSTVDDTRESFTATTHVLLEGMALAALVVWLFLRNWRATAIAATAMPLSLIPTFAFMQLMGFSLNVVTLLGLTLVVGILVDDAIVEIENIEKRIEAGATPYRAALIGADSIGLAVVACTATIVVVFTPVSFMPGISGQFFKEFGLTVAVAVMFSLLVARFLTPLLCAYFLKPAAHPKPRQPLHPTYRKALDWSLHHPVLASACAGAAVILMVVLVIGGALGVDFQPEGDPGYFYLTLQGPPGATRADMERAVQRLTSGMRANPDVATVFAQVGSSSGAGFGSNGGSDLRDGTITVVLKTNRQHNTKDVKQAIRPLLRATPDVRVTTQGGWGGADIDIILSGENVAQLEKTQLELQREMRDVKLISDVRPAPPPPGPELVVRPKPAEAARAGVTSEAMANILRIATIGDIDANVAKISDGKRRIPIRVRLSEDDRANLAVLSQLEAPTTGGKTTNLSAVADLAFQAGPGKITRYNRERRVEVQADLKNSTLGEATQAIYSLPIMQKVVSGKIPGVAPTNIGQAEALAELVPAFLGALGAGIFLIFAVLVILFGSLFKPLTIMMTLPLTLVGAILGLIITGQAISMPVFIGILMLFGIAAKNSILLVEFAIEDERSGQTRIQALLNACRERARPIIMTTVAMAAGMLPTAIGLGQGSEFRQPMAIAVIGGLISSTALSLVLVPVVYEFVDMFEERVKPFARKLITSKQPGDDAPIADDEETLVTNFEPADPARG
ncbi:MAG: efflux RND transporter permease subunit [Pseudomonadota bacterium]|jgi:HAE1 family hydrophobic/amphiphilic exporter-1